MKGLSSYVAANVDVEKPEFESEAFRVFLFRNLDIQENLRITTVDMPVHLRYHKPSSPTHALNSGDVSPAAASAAAAASTQPVAIVKIQNPRLLLACGSENVANYCPEKTVTSYCDSTGTTKCEYMQIPYKVVRN